MQITRSSIDTAKGPADWFTGDVDIDAVAAAPAPSRVSANLVHLMPGARTHWHRHPLSQTVFVTDGVGLCQRRGGPVEVDFCAEHGLGAEVEVIPVDQVSGAYERVLASDVRYRFVIDTKSLR